MDIKQALYLLLIAQSALLIIWIVLALTRTRLATTICLATVLGVPTAISLIAQYNLQETTILFLAISMYLVFCQIIIGLHRPARQLWVRTATSAYDHQPGDLVRLDDGSIKIVMEVLDSRTMRVRDPGALGWLRYQWLQLQTQLSTFTRRR